MGEDFRDFSALLTVNDRGTIAERYQLITRRLNLEFRDADSRTANSFYAGPYDRGIDRPACRLHDNGAARRRRWAAHSARGARP